MLVTVVVAPVATVHCDHNTGFLSVVWNGACEASTFQLDITLAEDEFSNQKTITTVPCSVQTDALPNCLWTAIIILEARDEQDSPHTG